MPQRVKASSFVSLPFDRYCFWWLVSMCLIICKMPYQFTYGQSKHTTTHEQTTKPPSRMAKLRRQHERRQKSICDQMAYVRDKREAGTLKPRRPREAAKLRPAHKPNMKRWQHKRDAILREIKRLKEARRVTVICSHCGQVILNERNF